MTIYCNICLRDNPTWIKGTGFQSLEVDREKALAECSGKLFLHLQEKHREVLAKHGQKIQQVMGHLLWYLVMESDDVDLGDNAVFVVGKLEEFEVSVMQLIGLEEATSKIVEEEEESATKESTN